MMFIIAYVKYHGVQVDVFLERVKGNESFTIHMLIRLLQRPLSIREQSTTTLKQFYKDQADIRTISGKELKTSHEIDLLEN